jgi:hypothetical protein
MGTATGWRALVARHAETSKRRARGRGGALAPRAGRGLQPWRCVRCPMAAIINRSPALRISRRIVGPREDTPQPRKLQLKGRSPSLHDATRGTDPCVAICESGVLTPQSRHANRGTDPSVARGARWRPRMAKPPPSPSHRGAAQERRRVARKADDGGFSAGLWTKAGRDWAPGRASPCTDARLASPVTGRDPARPHAPKQTTTKGAPTKAPFAHNTDWICGPRMTDLCGRWDQPGVTRRGWPGVDSPAEASLPV